MQYLYRSLLGLGLGVLAFSAQAQVGVGTTAPDANAALDISAGAGNNKGLLVPRLTQAQRTAITTTTQGLLVFQTDGAQPGFWYFQGGQWVALPSGTTTSSAWQRGGNVGTQAGSITDAQTIGTAATDFVGTTDNKDLVFKTNGAEQLRVTTDGSLYSRSTNGIILNNRDAPLITRGWDLFTSGGYQGIGRWGVFMLSSRLAFGIPNNVGANFSWVTFKVDSDVDQTLMTLSRSGNLGLGITEPTTRLSVVGGGSANPNTTGNTQSAGHYARFRDASNLVLDMGGNGSGGNWMQSTDATGLHMNYALRLNPNGGNVGIGTGTAAPTSTLTVGGTTAVAVRSGIVGGASGGATLLGTYSGTYLGLAPANNAADYALPDPTTCPGRIYYIRNNSSGQAAYLTLEAYAAGSRELYSGNGSGGFQFYTLNPNSNGKTIMCISDGVNWTIGQIN